VPITANKAQKPEAPPEASASPRRRRSEAWSGNCSAHDSAYV
jgi:hypothetical protein